MSNHVCNFLLTRTLVKTMSRKFSVSARKTLANQQNIVDFCVSIMIAEICSWAQTRAIVFFIFLIKFPKHVLMGWKFQGILKSSISFILKHSLVYLTYLIEVTQVLLNLSESLRVNYLRVKAQNFHLLFCNQWHLLTNFFCQKTKLSLITFHGGYQI